MEYGKCLSIDFYFRDCSQNEKHSWGHVTHQLLSIEFPSKRVFCFSVAKQEPTANYVIWNRPNSFDTFRKSPNCFFRTLKWHVRRRTTLNSSLNCRRYLLYHFILFLWFFFHLPKFFWWYEMNVNWSREWKESWSTFVFSSLPSILICKK
jgi:hypothetical protein